MKLGTTRICFYLGNIVIKLPNPFISHSNFLRGCTANWSERITYKKFKRTNCKFETLIAPTYFSVWFGLLSIQTKCKVLDRELTDTEYEILQEFFEDIKSENFGYYKNHLVCFDYGY